MAFTTPPAKLDELRQLFHKIDEDQSGTISKEEFAKAMECHPELHPKRVEHLFETLDFSGTGQIEYNAFIAATLASQDRLATSKSILAAFNTLDVDHDGYITKADLHDAFSGQLDDAFAE